MNDEFEFDAYKASEAMKEEIEWQIKQWERERMEEMLGDRADRTSSRSI